VQEITELKREGLRISAISELSGYDRKTIRKYLLAPSGRFMDRDPPCRASWNHSSRI
jgi:transposase